MFEVGEVVIYSATGVCKIEEITQKNFGGEKIKYYVLRPLLQTSSTVFVPVMNEKLTRKIHKILNRDDYEKIFSTVGGKSLERPESENERHEKFTDILDSGNREDLMLLVKDLHLLEKEQVESGRRMHIADERLLNAAEKILFEEVSYIYRVNTDSAADFILEKVKSYNK